MKNRLPNLKNLRALITVLKTDIGDDYRSYGEGSETPSMDLTVGWSPETGNWSWQTGDNSFSGVAYHHPIWAVVTLYRGRSTHSLETAREIQTQLIESQV